MRCFSYGIRVRPQPGRLAFTTSDERIGLMDPRLYHRLATPRPSALWNAETRKPNNRYPNRWNPVRILVFSTACMRRCDRIAPSLAIPYGSA